MSCSSTQRSEVGDGKLLSLNGINIVVVINNCLIQCVIDLTYLSYPLLNIIVPSKISCSQ